MVLVVEADAGERERLGSLLEDAGLEVVTCPGPSAPDYTCVGGRGEPCPLAHVADVVVLDVWLESDTVMVGTTAGELLSYYLASGKWVVAMDYRAGPLDLFTGERLLSIGRRPSQQELIDALETVVMSEPVARRGDG